MRNKYIKQFLLLIPFCCAWPLAAQNKVEKADKDTVLVSHQKSVQDCEIDKGHNSESLWRFTGASFILKGEELTHVMAGNLLNALQGRIPGLTVMSGSGEPGYDSPTFIGRGLSSWNLTGNDLLIYLDGFQVNLGFIASLSVYEIESVTYLKDAAALAMYGMEGGSGVLSIKTKRGVEMSKTRITANARYGLQSIIDLPTVLNAYDYTRFYNQARANDGLTPRYANIDLYKNGGDESHPDVDWYKEVLKDYSNIHNIDVSFTGGGKAAKYFVLMDYTGFGGYYKDAQAQDKDHGTNAKYTKFNIRGNVDIHITKNLSIKSEVVGSVEDKDTPAGFTAATLFSNLMRIPAAAFSVKNPNGSWGNSSVYNFNPVQLLRTNGIWNSHTRGLQTNFSFLEKLDAITPGLTLSGSLSFSNQYIGYTENKFTGLSYELLKDDTDQPKLGTDGKYTYKEMGTITDAINNGITNSWNRQIAQVGFSYSRDFGKHTLAGSLLAKRQTYTYFTLLFPIRNQGLSFSGSYAYDKRYLVSLTAGYNGSADFEEGHRYGLFPAIGLGWIASNEEFLKDKSWINFLKVRGSLGVAGNTNNNYRFLFEQKAESNSGWNFTTNNTWYTGYREGAIPNEDFTWERKTTANIGIDAKLFSKLTLNVDVFTEKRTKILENTIANVPSYTGFRLANENTGEVRNSGMELVLGYDDKIGDFSYYARGTFSFARNKILKISETVKPHEWLYSKGTRINQFRGLVSNGFYQATDFDADGLLRTGVPVSTYTNARPGDLKYVDQNGDGVINDYDKVPIGYSALPEISAGLNLGFRYKGFDFDMFLQGVTNRSVVLPYNYTHPFVNNNNITAFSANAWTPETAATATSPRLTTQVNDNNEQSTDFYMRNGSFIKLRSIELGYSFHAGKINNVRLSVSGNNLFTWDKIKDLEAEGLSNGYPLSKTVCVGLKVNF